MVPENLNSGPHGFIEFYTLSCLPCAKSLELIAISQVILLFLVQNPGPVVLSLKCIEESLWELLMSRD